MEQTSKQQEAIGLEWNSMLYLNLSLAFNKQSKEYPSYLATHIGAETKLLTETNFALASFTA